MAHLIEQSSNEFLNEGATISKKEMARLDGETSNAIFDDLANWNEQLKHLDIDWTAAEESDSQEPKS